MQGTRSGQRGTRPRVIVHNYGLSQWPSPPRPSKACFDPVRVLASRSRSQTPPPTYASHIAPGEPHAPHTAALLLIPNLARPILGRLTSGLASDPKLGQSNRSTVLYSPPSSALPGPSTMPPGAPTPMPDSKVLWFSFERNFFFAPPRLQFVGCLVAACAAAACCRHDPHGHGHVWCVPCCLLTLLLAGLSLSVVGY